MSWKDRLRPASFRGEPFHIEISNETLGRRAVQHEFPNREKPFTQDMGRAAENDEIEGYVLGEDYDQAKKRLKAAFSKPGPGEFIHPTDGSKIVQVGTVTFSQSQRRGGILSFTVKFLEAGDNRFPKSINDKAAILKENSDIAIEAAKNDFDNNFSIAGLPSFAVESSRDLIAKAQEAFDTATKPTSDAAESIAQLSYSTRNLVAESNDLLQAPSDLSNRLLDSFNLLQESLGASDEQTEALSSFYTFGSDQADVTGDTPIRKQEKVNQDSFKNFMVRVAAIKSAQSAQSTNFATFEEAEEKRVEISEIIDAQIKATDDAKVYQSLMDVNATLVEAVPDIDADLPRKREITTESTAVAMLIAYDIYEDSSVESDIISRNKIRHPGFIPSGKKLEVVGGQ